MSDTVAPDELAACRTQLAASTEQLVNVSNALLHKSLRRHKFSENCDGCRNLRDTLRGLIGLEPEKP